MSREIKYRQLISELTLMDDIFMKKILSDKECLELVLRIILDKDDLIVESVTSQKPYTNLLGHSLIMDIVATDSCEKIYNIEIQRNRDGASPKRARYHSSLIDSSSLEKSTSFDNLPETYVIFITDCDVLGYGNIIYNIDRIIKQNGKNFGDDSHIIYVNTEIPADTNLGKLMQDFVEKNYKKMNFKVLSNKARNFKETEEEVLKMNGVIERLREESLQKGMLEGMQKGMLEGMQKGMLEGMQKVIRSMHEDGMDLQTISRITNYSEDKIVEIINKE